MVLLYILAVSVVLIALGAWWKLASLRKATTKRLSAEYEQAQGYSPTHELFLSEGVQPPGDAFEHQAPGAATVPTPSLSHFPPPSMPSMPSPPAQPVQQPAMAPPPAQPVQQPAMAPPPAQPVQQPAMAPPPAQPAQQPATAPPPVTQTLPSAAPPPPPPTPAAPPTLPHRAPTHGLAELLSGFVMPSWLQPLENRSPTEAYFVTDVSTVIAHAGLEEEVSQLGCQTMSNDPQTIHVARGPARGVIEIHPAQPDERHGVPAGKVLVAIKATPSMAGAPQL